MTRAARVALALALLLIGVDVAPASACDACVTAGAGRATLAVPPGTPLAGYGSFTRRLLLPDLFDRYPHAFWFKPNTVQRDPLAVRALVLERDGTRVTWVTLDLIAVDQAFTRAVAARLGSDAGTLILSASHTHSGPGAFVDARVMGALVVDRLDPVVREAIIAAVVAAFRTAEANRGPAHVGVATVDGPPVIASRLGKPLDHEIVVLSLRRPGGAPVALMWNFGIHNTMLSAGNLELSADATGAASERLEAQLRVPALFVNGALGDVSPARHGPASLPDVGGELATAVLEGWRAAAPVTRPMLTTRAATLALPPPRLSLRNCLGRWVPRALTMPLGDVFPRESALTAVALGEVVWVAVPGELQTALGRRVKLAGRELFGHAFVAGVSNDYLGYLVTAEDYERPAYITCASVYGPDAGERITERTIELLYELRGRPRPAGRP